MSDTSRTECCSKANCGICSTLQVEHLISLHNRVEYLSSEFDSTIESIQVNLHKSRIHLHFQCRMALSSPKASGVLRQDELLKQIEELRDIEPIQVGLPAMLLLFGP